MKIRSYSYVCWILFVNSILTVGLLAQSPIITSITPNTAIQSQTLTVTITGQNTSFAITAGTGTINNVNSVWLSQGSSTINASYFWPTNATNLSANFTIPSNATIGSWSVNILPDTGAVLTLVNGFVIDSASTIVSIVPDTGKRGETLTVTITGQHSNFTTASGSSTVNNVGSVSFNQGSSTINAINATDFLATNATNLSANFTIPSNISIGKWDVNVAQIIGSVATLKNGFTIIHNPLEPPKVQNLTATAGNGHVTLMWSTVTSSRFLKYRIYRGTYQGGEILVDSTSSNITDTTRVSGGLVNGQSYYFYVTSMDSLRLESANSNEVYSMPFQSTEITAIIPNTAKQGQSLTVTITGQSTDFFTGSGSSTINNVNSVWLSQGSSTINASYFWPTNATNLSANFTIPSNISTGKWDINVAQIIGSVAALKNGFTIIQPPKVQNLTATAGNGQVSLYWNKNTESDFLKYRIYMGSDSLSLNLKDSSSASIFDTSKVITNLSNRTKYYFRVSALDSARLESGQSYAANATPAVLNAQREYNPDANTVLLMHMNETSDSTVNDVSGYGNNGTATGTTIVDGRFGKAKSFNGTSDRASVSSSAFLNVSPFLTLEVWLKPTGFSSVNTFLRKNGPNSQNGYLFHFKNNGTGLDFGINTNIGIGTNTTVNPTYFLDGKWHHVAATYDGSIARVYFDGLQVDQDNFNVIIGTNSTDPVSIGANDVYGEYFEGLIDEVRISNIARSPQEFNLQLPPVNLTATSSGVTVNLSWQNGGGAVPLMKYKIYRGTDSTNVSLVDSTTVTSSTNTVAGNGTYYYRISAVDSTGFEGAKSLAICVTTVGVPTNGLVAYYPFNGNASDESGDGNNGTITGTTIVDGIFGKAIRFSTVGDAVDVNRTDLKLPLFTAAAWINLDAYLQNHGHFIFSNLHSGVDQGWMLDLDSNTKLNFTMMAQPHLWSSSTLAAQKWYHVAVTYDGILMKIFINGIEDASLSFNGLQYGTNNSFPFRIGNHNYNTGEENSFFNGIIDEVRIYNRALSDTEVLALFNEEQTTDTTTTWKMQLKASIALYQDNENYVGVSDTATDGQDASFDVAEPLTSPGSYVSLFFPHPEWNSILGNNFAKDIKKNTSLADTVKRWYFQVKSNVVNDTVTLTFVNDRIPSAFGKYLTDLKTGKRINLINTSPYKYFNTSDTARSFMLIVGDTTAPSLALISPNGSNTWRSGTTKNISWSMSDGTGIDSVFVYSSSNGGSSYSLLKSLGPVQSTSWIVPSEYLSNNYSIRIISRDSIGNQSTTKSLKTFTVVGDSLATVNSAGWSLISSPLTPNDSSITNMFGTTSYLWYYTQATGYTQPSKIALGNGYWLGVTASKNWFVKGTASEADSSVQNLQIGYNIIGNNFVRNVSKSNMFFLKAGSYYDFNSAVSAGLISNTLYGYSSSAYSSIDTMSLFGGYWIGVLQSGVQLIQKPNVSVVAPFAKQTQINAMNWDLPISVSTPSLADNIAAIGIKPTSTVDFDPQYDAPRPPRNPGSKYLEIYSTNTGGNYPAILGSKYAKDYRGSDNPQWSFTVESSDQETVTLQWDPNVLKQLGANVRLALTDQSISKSIDMAVQASYSFDYNSPRIFTITSTITGVDNNTQNKPTSYALGQNFPNPFNPSTQIEFSIPQSSHVTLKIYDVLGKEVASLVDGAMGVGTYTTTWNAQNSPSGVYFYRLTAGSYTMTRKLLLLR